MIACRHEAAEPVTVTGIDIPGVVATVAWLCVACLQRVDPGEVGQRCQSCSWEDVRTFADPEPILYLAEPCVDHRPWRP